MPQFFKYQIQPTITIPPGGATSANQLTEIASLASIDTKLTAPLSVTGPLTDAQLRATPVPVSISSGITNPLPVTDSAAEASLASIDTKLTSPLAVTGTFFQATQPVSVASLPLPSGSATAANQATEIASLASIDTKLTSPLAVTGPLTDAQLRASPVPVSGTVVTGGLTDAQLRASAITVDASSFTQPVSGTFFQATQPVSGTFFQATQPVSGTVTVNAGTNLNTSGLNLEVTQVAFSAKSMSALINNPFDEVVITYVGATTNIATVVYKLAAATVNTLTMTYDGSNRLIDVVKS